MALERDRDREEKEWGVEAAMRALLERNWYSF